MGLLIGYNCLQALPPCSLVSGRCNQPFAQETDLGWGIVGCVEPYEEVDDVNGLSRVITHEVPESLQPQIDRLKAPTEAWYPHAEVRYACQATIKEMVTPLHIRRLLEADFPGRKHEETIMSQDDIRFLKIIGSSIKQQDDGYFVISNKEN